MTSTGYATPTFAHLKYPCINPFSPADRNSVDPNQTAHNAHNEPLDQNLHCLPFCFDCDRYLKQCF